MTAGPGPRKVHFETWGCTTNVGDTRTMAGLLAAEGHRLVDDVDEADVVVLNTCTVVDTTDARIEHRLRTLRAAGKEVIATGCMAAAQPERLEATAPGLPMLSPRYLHHIDDVVAGRPFTPAYRPKTGLPRSLGATDAIVQLAEGCAFSCTYCITKRARGDQTSHPLDALVADVREAVARGAIEIKLTAQDTSGYGLDTGTDLAALIRGITAIGGDFRLRVGMMHPRTAHRIRDDLLDAMDHEKVYKFLHLPIQTGSPRILKAMGRGDGFAEFWSMIDAFRERFPPPSSVVSTDIIVGFPGETAQDHAQTVALLQRLQPEHVNITRFSARPGTEAKTLPGRVRTDVAKARSRALTQQVWSMWDAGHPKRIGEELVLYVVEEGKKPGSVMCRGPAYEPVVLPVSSDVVPLGSRVTGRIVDAQTTYFLAEPVSVPVRVAKARAE